MNKLNQWKLYLSEFIGTALLLLSGLSLVIFMYGEGNIVTQYIPNLRVRQVISGFIWGCFGASIAISPVGKVSGAHINPAVTLAFRLFGKIDLRTSIGYISAQIGGGIVGCLPLIAWGAMGKSIEYGATLPGQGYSTSTVLMGEIITTFCLVGGLILFIGFRNLRQYTPAMIPFLYGIMVPLEADISGTSTNPARSIGPAVISGQWDGWWIYWVGPVIGAILASLVFSFMAKRITEAKLYHFDSEQDRLFRKKSQTS